jgi:hypothetical protein
LIAPLKGFPDRKLTRHRNSRKSRPDASRSPRRAGGIKGD